jgi:ATP-binding cassette subfamily B (MDR/TAP) protein 1
MTAKTGQFIAVVGPSGCGKSSVVALLERFYDPTSGTIRIDEQPLADMSPGAYRSHVAWVPQEAALYPNSIQQNVLLGLGSNPGPDEGQVEASLRAANAWDFVSSLPDGVHTLCGTNGSHLSGGQKQRIAIARALIRRPKLLLLDEATSALDTASESIVQQSLHYESSRRDTVTLAVAHRLSTIKHADCIYVFDGGRIVEKGTHDDLVAQDGIYKKLCDVQSLDAGTGL